MKHPIIQIEGMDGSGKSFLAKHIIDNHKAAYIHVSNYADKAKTIAQHIPMIDFGVRWAHELKLSPVLLDRHWLTLMVYTAVFDNEADKALVDAFFWGEDMNRCMNVADHLILCMPPKEVYLERFEKIKTERTELYTNMEDIYDVFHCLYHGINHKLLTNANLQRIQSLGGLKQSGKVHLYDYTTDGADIATWLATEGIL